MKEICAYLVHTLIRPILKSSCLKPAHIPIESRGPHHGVVVVVMMENPKRRTRRLAVSRRQPATCLIRAGRANFEQGLWIMEGACVQCDTATLPAMLRLAYPYKLLWHDAHYGPNRASYGVGDVSYGLLQPEI